MTVGPTSFPLEYSLSPVLPSRTVNLKFAITQKANKSCDKCFGTPSYFDITEGNQFLAAWRWSITVNSSILPPGQSVLGGYGGGGP